MSGNGGGREGWDAGLGLGREGAGQGAREKALGPDHPDVALFLNNLGALYQDTGLNTK